MILKPKLINRPLTSLCTWNRSTRKNVSSESYTCQHRNDKRVWDRFLSWHSIYEILDWAFTCKMLSIVSLQFRLLPAMFVVLWFSPETVCCMILASMTAIMKNAVDRRELVFLFLHFSLSLAVSGERGRRSIGWLTACLLYSTLRK